MFPPAFAFLAKCKKQKLLLLLLLLRLLLLLHLFVDCLDVCLVNVDVGSLSLMCQVLGALVLAYCRR